MTKRNFKDPLYKAWRKKIYELDNYCCQWPGCNRKKKLNAHHIKKWSEYPGLRYNIYNGITLCSDHHNMIKNMEDSYAETFFKIVSNRNKGKDNETK